MANEVKKTEQTKVKKPRIESIDAFRGWTILVMIFVIAVAAGGYPDLPQKMSWMGSLSISTWNHADVAWETPIALTNTLAVGPVLHGLVELVLQLTKDLDEGKTINAVVGETNDGKVNDIQKIVLTKDDVFSAYENLSEDFALGSVGAGTGTCAFSWKGGIGSASRLIELEGKEYTVGALLQTNFGGDLTIMGVPVGRELKSQKPVESDGSCMILLATDAPLSARQLKRLAKRSMLGLGRTGSVLGHGSGDYAIAFSTSRAGIEWVEEGPCLKDENLDTLFLSVIEAVEESVYDSLFTSETAVGRDGNKLEQIPVEEVVTILKNHQYKSPLPLKN